MKRNTFALPLAAILLAAALVGCAKPAPAPVAIPASAPAPDDAATTVFNKTAVDIWDKIDADTSDRFASNFALSLGSDGGELSHSWAFGDTVDDITEALDFGTETGYWHVTIMMRYVWDGFDWIPGKPAGAKPCDAVLTGVTFSPLCGVWEQEYGDNGYQIVIHAADNMDIAAGEREAGVYLTHNFAERGASFDGTADYLQGDLKIEMGDRFHIDISESDTGSEITLKSRELVVNIDPERAPYYFHRVSGLPEE